MERETLRPTALFDLASDPFEMRNLVAERSVEAVVKLLAERLSAWSRGRPFTA
jgi:hypothetical protein